MKIVMFYHSLISDWNHGNAHFLRGVVGELLDRRHDVQVYEPRDAWSVQNLVGEFGTGPVDAFHEAYPQLRGVSRRYDAGSLDLDRALGEADLVLVHEWSDHELVRRINRHRATARGYRLLFHDTHHRAVTAPQEMAAYELTNFDGVLAFGRVLRDLYLDRGWAQRAWTWHEAADTRVFKPLPPPDPKEGDVVWVGNWGDGERTAELQAFLLGPIAQLNLKARVHGVRYSDEAIGMLKRAGVAYANWLPNFRAPEAFAAFKCTVHVPRRPYVEALPGIPTIRPFEAMACGIPLVCSPWDDAEHLFTPGGDYLVARDGREMMEHLRLLTNDQQAAAELAARGRRTILDRHTCGHRVDELLDVYSELTASPASATNALAATPAGVN